MSQYSPFSKEELLPQAERLEVKRRKGELFIGLPKESVLKKIDAVVHFHEDLLKVKEVLKMNIQQKLHQ